MGILSLRNVSCFTVSLGLVILLSGCGRREPEPVSREKAVPVETERDEGEEKRREAVKEKEGELVNTEWQISVTPLSGESRESKSDTLRFFNGKVVSKVFEAEGYAATNYTLRIAPDGTIIWETMQTSEGVGMVFWRGERRGDAMSGIISKHPEGKEHEDFSFISTSFKKIE